MYPITIHPTGIEIHATHASSTELFSAISSGTENCPAKHLSELRRHVDRDPQ